MLDEFPGLAEGQIEARQPGAGLSQELLESGQAGEFANLGQGNVDFSGIIRMLEAAGD